MNEKLIKKYIPEQFRKVIINTQEGGMQRSISMFKAGGATTPEHLIHTEPLRGGHLGWTSHPDMHQVVLPNNDRILVGYEYKSALETCAKAHISAKTGLVTLLSPIHSSAWTNKSLSEFFDAHVCYNETQFPFGSRRIGDYQAFEGMQFKTNGNKGIAVFNPRPDYRIKVDRKISREVRKEMIANRDLMEGKGDLIRGSWATIGAWDSNPKVHAMAMEMSPSASMADLLANHYSVMHYFKNVKGLLHTEGMHEGKCKDGQVLELADTSYAKMLYRITGGNPSHVYLSLVLASEREAYTRDILNMAPVFIAARGGYSLTEIKK